MPQVIIDNFPSEIKSEPFDVGVSVKGAKDGINYLRIELYKDGSTEYFGQTFNGKDWYGGSDGKSYLTIEIVNGSASATLKGRIIEPDSGDFKLKIKRYTSSGSGSNDTENPVALKINYILVTATPVKTNTPIPLLASATTAIPVKTETTASIPPTFRSATETIIPISEKSPEVLAAISEVENTVVPITREIEKEAYFPLFPAFIFAIGLSLVGIGVLLLYNDYNASKK